MFGWMPEAASSYAGRMDSLLLTITLIVGVWFLAAEAFLVYAALRFRRVPGRSAAYLPARSLGAMAWVLVPCAAILVCDLVIDAIAAPVWDEIKLELPPHDQLVRITGEQWAWRFRYAGPDGRLDSADDLEVVGELRAPLGRVVQFELTARDVLHSFWVPELRLKQDAVPGRAIRGWFQPTREGSFEVVCAEICGVSHTMMKATLRVEPPEAYARWLAEQIAARGEGAG
jgi:cytochrome c oxidase subunit 2